MMIGSAIPASLDLPTAGLPNQPAAVGELAEGDDLAGLEVISSEELAQHRGGFAWKGVQIGLGAEISTYLNGQLALQTTISWTETGAQTTQFVSGALTPADAAQLQAGILTSGGISMRVGNSDVFLANGGQTAIIHQTDGAIQNILVNTASDVEVTQMVDAALDLGNFGQFQQSLINTRIGEAAGDMVGQAIIFGN